MVVRDYSAPQRLGFDMDAPCPVHGWPNTVVHSRAADTHYPAHLGPLSLKVVLSGRQYYETDELRYAVTPQRYLLLGDGRRHSHGVDEESDLLVLMFRRGLAEEVLASLVTPPGKLLDEPGRQAGPVAFFEQTYPRDRVLDGLLSSLQRNIHDGMSQDELDHYFHPIMARLLHIHQGVWREIARLPAVRYATRVELHRRLSRARDYMDACYTEAIDLARIAAVAELSPHHLLRVFKKAYGVTPHRYLTERRLEHAKFLLAQTSRSVTDVCLDVGFESLGSFSSLFKKRVGVPPSAFRDLQAA